jgi:ACS family pantothenate transporter-like MFS transporter
VIFWVKSYNVTGKKPVFSVADINIIPLGVCLPLLLVLFSPKCTPFPSFHTKKLNHNTQINIITIVCALANSWISDSLPGAARWPGMLFASIMAVIFPIALAATPVHPKWKAQRWVLYCEFFFHSSCKEEMIRE